MTAAPQRPRGSTEQMAELIDTLELPTLQKSVMRQRWLDQTVWMSRQAKVARRRHQLLRIPIIVGGIAVPALITILLAAGNSPTVDWLTIGSVTVATHSIRLLAFLMSGLVAICAGLEELLHYGERWRHYRRTAELLKTLGWQFITLSLTFRKFSSHAAAFTTFSERVEDTLNEDVEGYLDQIAVGPTGRTTKPDVVT